MLSFEVPLTHSYHDSGQVYKSPSNWKSKDLNKLGKWDPASVWLNNGFELELWREGDFNSLESLTVKRKPSAAPVHDRDGKCYNFADIAPTVDPLKAGDFIW